MLDKKFMKKALIKAQKITLDIPVCAIIVKDNRIISSAINKREKDNILTYHAEILAIEKANKKLKNWRLSDCDMYVTLEPCPMCGWAILNSKIDNLYFGSYDYNYGAFSTLNLLKYANSKINIKGGILEGECDKLLKEYFKSLRK